jgi:apolipoprotein N-acyltransferase
MRKLVSELIDDYLENEGKLFEDMDEAIRIEDADIPHEQKWQAEKYLHWARLHVEAENQANLQDDYIQQVIWPSVKMEALRDLEYTKGKTTKDAIEEKAKTIQRYKDAALRRRNRNAHAERYVAVYWSNSTH